jgi:hypothetical protein
LTPPDEQATFLKTKSTKTDALNLSKVGNLGEYAICDRFRFYRPAGSQ